MNFNDSERIVYVLGNGTSREIFPEWDFLSNNFDVKWQANPAIPTQEWFNATPGLSRGNSIELYNHMRIWRMAVQNETDVIVLYNRSEKLESDELITEVFINLLDISYASKVFDVALLGYYQEYCSLTTGNIRITEDVSLRNIFNAQGSFAYWVSSAGANQLLNKMLLEPLPTSVLVPSLPTSKVMIPALFRYGPDVNSPAPIDKSVICTDSVEIFELSIETFVAYSAIALIIGLVIGAFFVIISICNNTKPCQFPPDSDDKNDKLKIDNKTETERDTKIKNLIERNDVEELNIDYIPSIEEEINQF